MCSKTNPNINPRTEMTTPTTPTDDQRTGLVRVDDMQLARAIAALTGETIETCLAELQSIREEDAA